MKRLFTALTLCLPIGALAYDQGTGRHAAPLTRSPVAPQYGTPTYGAPRHSAPAYGNPSSTDAAGRSAQPQLDSKSSSDGSRVPPEDTSPAAPGAREDP